MKLLVAALLGPLLACSSNLTPFPSGTGTDGGTGTTPDSGTGVCSYPEGSTGTSPGQLVESGFNWQGYAPNQQASSSISMEDFFDCDGSKGINAVIVDVSATWCAACQAEATDLPKLFSSYDSMGIKHITLMVQDASMALATLGTATDWKKMYGLTDVYVAADPSFSFQPSGASGSVTLPLNILIDPRTMKILKVTQGYLAHYPLTPDADAVAVAKKNAAH